jgi:hypothetical protein
MEKRILTFLVAFMSIAAIAQPPPPPPPNPGGGQLKINEVDYDIPGSDTSEFIEIYNTGAPVNLNGYILLLINGSNNTVYDTVFFPSTMLATNDFYVICGSGGNVVNCDQMLADTANIIQNGAPDAIAIIDLAGPFLEDAVSYEGDVPNFTETTGVTASNADSNVGDLLSMSRYPDGSDSNDNDADFSRICSTPGEPNCGPVSIAKQEKRSFTIFPNPVNDKFTLTFTGINTGKVAVSNLLGESMINGKLNSTGKLAVDVSILPQGFYFVTVETGNEILTKRFVKR